MPAGRPPKYRKEFCQKLIEHMKGGLSFKTFGAEIDVAEDTLHDWCKKHKEFSESKNKGRALQEQFYEKFGRGAMAGKVPGFNATAFIWMTKNMLRWRDRHEITGSDGGPIESKVEMKVVVEDYTSKKDD